MAGISNQGSAYGVEVQYPHVSSDVESVEASAISNSQQATSRPAIHLSRECQIQEAALLSFSAPMPAQVALLLHLSTREWKKLLYWLDVSGLPLYLLDRLTQLAFIDALPKWVVADLQQKRKDNFQRTRGMADESVAIQLAFQESALRYAVMKGISLSPFSVPRPELRHQFDLDYLVATKSALEARKVLERRGYRLYGVDGNQWQFKINQAPNLSVKDTYKDVPYRTVELHLDDESAEGSSRLDRAEYRNIQGIVMRVLSPVDIFLGQAMHVFKDVSNGFSRPAHLLEFYRHVLARFDDDVFWRELRVRMQEDRTACLKVGVVTYLIASIMSDFAPAALTSWTVDTLPNSARLWIERYSRRVIFAKPWGTKLYLLLLKELENGGFAAEGLDRKSIWPSQLPKAVIRNTASSTLLTRIKRYRVQIDFVLSRLRFHLVEGVRCKAEAHRWRQYKDRYCS